MYVCMYVCMYQHVYIYIYIYIHTYTYLYIHTYILYTCIYTCVCLYIHRKDLENMNRSTHYAKKSSRICEKRRAYAKKAVNYETIHAICQYINIIYLYIIYVHMHIYLSYIMCDKMHAICQKCVKEP
jgi:hypothetical protein